MFGRKQKGEVDLSGSVSRFVDLHRDCFSRVKHLKILLDSLSLQVCPQTQFSAQFLATLSNIRVPLCMYRKVAEVENVSLTISQPFKCSNGWENRNSFFSFS